MAVSVIAIASRGNRVTRPPNLGVNTSDTVSQRPGLTSSARKGCLVMRVRLWIATAAAIVGAAAVVPPAAQAAAPRCAAHGSLPARVSLHRDHVVIHSVLRGSSGCHGQRTDNGASAMLHRPGSPDENLRWRRFGSTQKIDLYINLDRTGTYRITAGDVQLYNHRYRRVAYRWRNTAMIVKHAGRFTHVAAGTSSVGGRAEHYSKFGWTGYGGVAVHLQRRAVGSSEWRTLRTARADSSGRVSFATDTDASHRYRLSFGSTSAVWGATSKRVRG
jgi:hypothetical protein